jgi:hypothetical protein
MWILFYILKHTVLEVKAVTIGEEE